MLRLNEVLSSFGPRFIKVSAPTPGDPKSGKMAVERGFQLKPYAMDDPALATWMDDGGNYGVLAGMGIIIVDIDVAGILSLPDTFTVASGSGHGRHLYYRSNIDDNATISKDDEHIADVQARYKYVVGPGCRHHSGGIYEIIDNRPLVWLDVPALEAATKGAGCVINWAFKVRKDIDDAAAKEKDLLGRDISIEELIDLSKLTQTGNDEYQGAHPIHGSSTGQNFTVNTEKNCWHCFRCNSGGGSLSWIAVKSGIISCEEAKPGALRGVLFIKAKQAAEKLGYKISFMSDKYDDEKNFFQEKNELSKKMFVPSLLGDKILKEYPTITVRKHVFVYNKAKGIYVDEGESWIESIATMMLGKSFRKNRVDETVSYVRYKTIKEEIPKMNPERLAVNNGILSLLTGELGPFTPDDFHIAKIPTNYDPEAKCPEWMKCLKFLQLSDDDISTLQEFMGYTLWRAYPWAKSLMILGPPRAGKTTVIMLWTKMLGKENVSTVTLNDISDDRFSGSDLLGKMMNATGELAPTEIRDTTKFKRITGRDPIRAQEKFVKAFDFYPYAKLVFGMNKLAAVPYEDLAFFERAKRITFPYSIPKSLQDSSIDVKLEAELSGVLNWALEGLRRLMERDGFDDKRGAADESEDYRMHQAPFEYFWETLVEEEYQCVIIREHFTEVFDAFCRDHQIFKITPHELYKRMREKGIDEKRKKIESERLYVWAGIKWRDIIYPIQSLASVYYYTTSQGNEYQKITVNLTEKPEESGQTPLVSPEIRETISVGNLMRLKFQSNSSNLSFKDWQALARDLLTYITDNR